MKHGWIEQVPGIPLIEGRLLREGVRLGGLVEERVEERVEELGNLGRLVMGGKRGELGEGGCTFDALPGGSF